MSEADLLSSPSVNLAEFVAAETGVKISAIKIVRNPVDTEKFSPDGKKATLTFEKSPANADFKIVYFAGRLEARKGIEYLIEAVPQILKEVPQARFVLVGADTNTGAGKSSVLKSLKTTLTKSDSLGKVFFASHVPLDAMPEYYRAADVCVVPSLFDNAPYTVLEALASGRPVVGSTAGGTPEYIKHDKTGLHVEKADSKALAQAIISLLQDDQKRLRMAQAARTEAKTQYGCDVIAAEALKSYGQTIEIHKRRRSEPIYKHPPEQLAKDVVQFVRGYHGHLHSFGEDLSLRYRTGLGLKLLFTRPKLSMVKVALASGKMADRLSSHKSHGLRKLVSRLETTVQHKSQEDWE